MITQKQLEEIKSLHRPGESHGSNTVLNLVAEIERLRGELQMAGCNLPLDSAAYARAAKALNG